ncbi:hypothetical protein [Bernardetia sp.]|uniref:hypothetical protein n=1 Tax=Bernardetia sp. TaxID=1937974 RepID=UPI0025C2BF30|nr:hypothetical protein [Bernardetia sp.]
MKKYFVLKFSVLSLFIIAFFSCTNQTVVSKEVVNIDTTKNIVLEKSVDANTDQKGIFSWQLGLCEYKGTYDTTKYTREEIQNLFAISTMVIVLQTSCTVSDYKKVNTLSIVDLDKERNDKGAYLSNVATKFPMDYFSILRGKMNQLEIEYRFKKRAIEAYQNPKVLEHSPVDCQKYADAIIAQDDRTIQVCREMIEERVKNGSYPKSLLDNFEKEAKTAQAIKYATTQLLTYGWWNCVTPVIYKDESEKNYNKFKSIFEDITEECDEP